MPEGPTVIEAPSGEHSQSQRRRITTSLTPSERSDGGSSSFRPRTRDQHDHSRRKVEFFRVQDLDELVHKRVEEVRMPHHGKLKTIAANAYNSPFSKGILGCEFLKKFMILTFDCYSRQSNPVQHLRQYQDKMVIYTRNDSIFAESFLPP